MFPTTFKTEDIIKSEAEIIGQTEINAVSEKNANPEAALDNLKRSALTATNLNSAILLLNIAGKKFLFAGDVGIKSFEAIPDYENVLSKLYWLKVPHHGSENNISSSLIALMQTKFAVISGKGHVSPEVIACFKHYKTEVFITGEHGPYFYNESHDTLLEKPGSSPT